MFLKITKSILEAINRGVQLALDDYEDDNQINSKTNIVKNKNVVKDLIDFHEQVVDLGLPSGTWWAKYNLGCDWKKLNDLENWSKTHYGYNTDAKEWYGDFYAWGELEPKNVYNWDNYKFTDENDKLIKYSSVDSMCKDNKADYITELQPEDDAAYQYDKRFRIPTLKQINELMQYTECKKVENYNNIRGLNGFVLYSTLNDNDIFIPAAGCIDGIMTNYSGEEAYFWAADVASYSRGAHRINIFANSYDTKTTRARANGLSIRPVYNKR